ncbi:MAG TPA: hypothetical protein VIL86_19805 [Tepidisphaeraceae bacterium]
MRNSSDPSAHRARERQIMQHVERLLDDERLRIDTTRGRRPLNTFMFSFTQSNRGVELKRIMSEMGLPDRELEALMPQGRMLDVVAKRKGWFGKKAVGRLRVMCVSPVRELLKGENPSPLNGQDIKKILAEAATPTDVPATIVLMSTCGFTLEAHELAERRADRTLILVEPNDAGGWTVSGPVETKALTDLFDPEAEHEKRQRVRGFIEAAQFELTGSGIATDKVAAKTQLPLQLIERELKSYAQEHAGLSAKRLDGRVVLFREGTAPVKASGESAMPFLERMKALFARKGENEKKIAFLAERRTALGQQRDRSYEELTAMEVKEQALHDQFKSGASALAKRRITSQMLQLRKDIERRQQLQAVLNQQINVVSTHLHNLELVQQGQSAKLPDAEEMASDAARAEDMLAELEAETELAGTVGAMAHAGMTAEEQALYEELEKETGEAGPGMRMTLERVEEQEEAAEERASTTPERNQSAPIPPTPEPKRNEPEAG